MFIQASVTVGQGDGAYAVPLHSKDDGPSRANFHGSSNYGRVSVYTPSLYLSMDEEAAKVLIQALQDGLIDLKVKAAQSAAEAA